MGDGRRDRMPVDSSSTTISREVLTDKGKTGRNRIEGREIK